MSILKWADKASGTPVLYNTVNVGDGPISLSFKTDASSNIYVLTTGFNDNTYTITKFDTNGDVLSNTTTALTNCNNPGHAAFLGTDKIIVTSNTDSTYCIVTLPE